jgi:pimeloyl-ACP methyl ester carboxylesterase
VHALLAQGRALGGFVGVSGWCPFEARVGAAAAAAAGREAGGGAARVRRVREILASDRGGGYGVESAEGEDEGACLATPVFLAYCRDDDVVPVVNGEQLRERLRGLGMEVQWRDYKEGGHWVNEPEGVDDLIRFLRTCCKT